jgi:hypothetical protein
MNNKQYIKVDGEPGTLPFTTEHISAKLKEFFGESVEVDVSSSAWTIYPTIYVASTKFPNFFDLNAPPSILVKVGSNNELEIVANFDKNKDYSNKCECGMKSAFGDTYDWHSTWCPESKKR